MEEHAYLWTQLPSIPSCPPSRKHWCGMFGGSAGKPRHTFQAAADTPVHHGWSLVLEELRVGMRMLLLSYFFSSHRIQRNDEAAFSRFFPPWFSEMASRGPSDGPTSRVFNYQNYGMSTSPTSEVTCQLRTWLSGAYPQPPLLLG